MASRHTSEGTESDKENVGRKPGECEDEEDKSGSSEYEDDEFDDGFDARPSYAVGDVPERGFLYPTRLKDLSSIQRRLEFDDSCLSTLTSATQDSNRIKTFLRLRPVVYRPKAAIKTSDIYVLENEETLRVVGSKSKLHNPFGGEVKFKFTKVFGAEETQSTVFEEVVKPLVEAFLHGENSLIFSYGGTNSGKTYTMQGTGTQFGMLPRALEYLFNSLDDRVYTQGNIKPNPLRTFHSLMEKDVKDMEATKQRIISSIKNKHAEELTSFRASLRSNTSSVATDGHLVLLDKIGHQQMQSSLAQYEPDAKLNAIWVSFSEIYNEKVYDLFENTVKGKKRKELKLITDKHGRVFVKELTEVCVYNASEAFQLFLAGKNHLKFASTQANSNSSRSHSFFTLKMVFVAVAKGVAYPYKFAQMSFCDLAGIERVAQTGNMGIRLKESGSINQSLFVLIKLIRAMRTRQGGDHPSTHLPFRESKLTKLFHGFLVSSSHTSMIVNINPDPSMVDTSMQVLQNSAVASEVIMCQRVEPPVHLSSSFFQKVRESIGATKKIHTELDSTYLNDEDDGGSQGGNSPEYALPTVICAPKHVEEDSQTKILRLEAKIAALEEEVHTIEDRTRKEMTVEFTKLQEEYEVSQKELWKQKEEGLNMINSRRVSLAAQIWNAVHAKEDKQVGTSPITSRAPKSPENVVQANQNGYMTPAETSIDFQAEWKRTQVQNYELNNELQDLKRSCKCFQECISERNAVIATLQTQYEELQQRIAEERQNHSRLMALKDQEIASVKQNDPDKLKEATLSQIQELMKELQSKEETSEALQTELAEAKALCIDYDTRLNEANEKIEKLTTDLNNLHAEKQQVESDIEILHLAMDDMKEKHSKLENANKIHAVPSKRSTRRRPL